MTATTWGMTACRPSCQAYPTCTPSPCSIAPTSQMQVLHPSSAPPLPARLVPCIICMRAHKGATSCIIRSAAAFEHGISPSSEWFKTLYEPMPILCCCLLASVDCCEVSGQPPILPDMSSAPPSLCMLVHSATVMACCRHHWTEPEQSVDQPEPGFVPRAHRHRSGFCGCTAPAAHTRPHLL